MKKLIARIEFEVKDEEDFKNQKDNGQLPGEIWTLIKRTQKERKR